MQPSGIGPGLIRILPSTAPDLLRGLFTPGRVLEADVISVFQDRAVLSFGQGARLEVALQTLLQEGQRVRVQVQPQPQQAGAQPVTVTLRLLGLAHDAAAATAQTAQAPAADARSAQPAAPQVVWLPIPLPDGRQGWAQLHIDEDDSPRTRAQKGGPVQQVRIWWETPGLGAVQVALDAAGTSLAAIFTAAAAESKGALDRALPELQQRLAQVGFPEARLGSRTAAPGEGIEPARIEGASRLDKRM